MSNASSRRARVPMDNHGGPGRKDNSSIQRGTWSKVVSTALFRFTRTFPMSHPKGERARLDTLPQRLSGLGSAYVALAMSHEGGKDHLYEQSEKIRYPQLP